MRDVEILLRYFGLRFRLADYTGNLKAFLDGTVNQFNDEWTRGDSRIKEAAEDFNSAILATFEIFGTSAFYRWSEGGYEGRFNRAVFDVMVYYFSNRSIAGAAVENKSDVEAAFRWLCENDPLFVESIQTTTKTPLATHRRLERWGKALASATEHPVRTPRLDNNRVLP